MRSDFNISRFSLLILHFSFLVFFLVTCKSIPVVSDLFMQEDKFVPLEKGASVYLFANVPEARRILEILPIRELKEEQTADLLDRTGMAVAALFPQNSGKRFQLAAWGNYPSFGAGFAFGFDRNWKSRRSQEGRFWYSSANRLSIALTSKQAFAAASLNEIPAEPRTAVSSQAEIPEGFNTFRKGSPLSCWLIDPDITITRVFQNAGIPIQVPVEELFINIFPLDSGYETILRFQLENSQQARGMAAMLNLASRFFNSDDTNFIFGSLLFTNTPVQKDNALEIKSGVLNEKEMLEIFNMFFGI